MLWFDPFVKAIIHAAPLGLSHAIVLMAVALNFVASDTLMFAHIIRVEVHS